MRLGLVLLALAACSSPAAARPAWPKATVSEIDGGESLAPRAAARTVAATSEVERGSEKTPVEGAAVAAPSSSAAEPAAASPTDMIPDDETITGEEIVIEIEE
jgi:hypothetical protein